MSSVNLVVRGVAMLKLERLLVPTDFSEASNDALPHAFEIASRFKAEITMVHVRTPFSGDSTHPEFQFFDEGKYEEYVANELKERSSRARSDLSVTTVAKMNISAPSGILEAIEENEIDLVVMATHGRSELANFFLGSVAEKVVRYSPVPVLTVAPDRPGYRRAPDYQRILATFDFSKHSHEAVKGAQQLAASYGAHLQVLYVIEQEVHPGYYETWKKSVSEDAPAFEAEAKKSLVDHLGAQAMAGAELRVEIGTGDGKAYSKIVSFAGENEVDLVVMGTHGLSGFQHMLLGSTTERVIRTAPCPVLTFHLGEQADRAD
jgi:nucleotide-binding universal stress UspA family protein